MAEVCWFAWNYALLNVIGLGVGLVVGTWLLAASPNATIPGWSGTPIEQVLWYAVATVLYSTGVLGLGLLVPALAVWRLAIHVAGHPRTMALVEASAVIALAIILIPRTRPGEVALIAGVPMLLFAVLARLPPDHQTG